MRRADGGRGREEGQEERVAVLAAQCAVLDAGLLGEGGWGDYRGEEGDAQCGCEEGVRVPGTVMAVVNRLGS